MLYITQLTVCRIIRYVYWNVCYILGMRWECVSDAIDHTAYCVTEYQIHLLKGLLQTRAVSITFLNLKQMSDHASMFCCWQPRWRNQRQSNVCRFMCKTELNKGPLERNNVNEAIVAIFDNTGMRLTNQLRYTFKVHLLLILINPSSLASSLLF